MACGCRKVRNKTTVHRVTYRDGRDPQEFLSEPEARAAARVNGGTYTKVLKPV